MIQNKTVVLKNGYVVSDDFSIKQADVKIENGKIIEISDDLSGNIIFDMHRKYVLPGFIDTHIHGAYGVRISDRKTKPALNKVTEFEATQGVTSLAITTAASEFSHILEQISVAKEASAASQGTKIVGIHLEGPFISKKYKGAMNPAYILEYDIQKFDEMLRLAPNLIKIITVAPEKKNSREFIEYVTQKGVTVSLGHTDANYEEAQVAIAAGASQVTHVFNAMRAFNHREPGVLGAAFSCDSVTCEMICDYVHLHPATVQMVYRLKGADRINIISDSGHAAGLCVTEFEADGLMRYVKNGVVQLADGTIAGSAKTMADGVKNLILSGIPIEDVSKMASINPARSLKMDNMVGSIAVGKLADITVLDENYDVCYTFINGNLAYQR